MTEVIGTPAYQQIAGDLRARIASGELAVGSPIPSTAKLSERYGVSVTVVRAAINQLRAAGLVVGQPGKAVYVRATPEAMANERVQLDDLAEQVKELRAGLADVSRRYDQTAVDQLRAELTELRRQLGVFHTQLMDLYSRMGQPYPHEGARATDQGAPAKRRRAAGGTDSSL
ncbi:MAG TPA: winged helix-turn-helix domain-containing protein [Gemmataceae bacterium]|nr:winged helix-turn-helix domain-containing protein [Gemmataceae bacterium]